MGPKEPKVHSVWNKVVSLSLSLSLSSSMVYIPLSFFLSGSVSPSLFPPHPSLSFSLPQASNRCADSRPVFPLMVGPLWGCYIAELNLLKEFDWSPTLTAKVPDRVTLAYPPHSSHLSPPPFAPPWITQPLFSSRSCTSRGGRVLTFIQHTLKLV